MSSGPQQPNIAEFLDRADDYVRRGDAKAAVTFYQAALQSARKLPSLDGPILERLRSAQKFIQDRAVQFRQSLDRVFESCDSAVGQSKTRLSHAFGMLNGERTIFPQQPSVFYYPYLAQRQFFERDEFDWVPAIEAAVPEIRQELLSLVESGPNFRPYVQDSPDRPRREFHHLNNNQEWSALYIWRDSKLVSEVAQRCPKTVEALDRVPMTHIGQRTPSALFSRLEPGAHIPPHAGMLNCRLICHLPLIVPGGCWLRVGNEKREWEEGKMLIFDDSIEHEAKNPTGEVRIILLFDMWRPELSEFEKQTISSIFEAIDEFGEVPND